MAIMPLLMLFAGCSTMPTATVILNEDAPLENAYRVMLPAGTTITLPTRESAEQIRAVAVNELQQTAGTGGDCAVTLKAPLQLVSPAYIAHRDAREQTLRNTIATLRANQ